MSRRTEIITSSDSDTDTTESELSSGPKRAKNAYIDAERRVEIEKKKLEEAKKDLRRKRRKYKEVKIGEDDNSDSTKTKENASVATETKENASVATETGATEENVTQKYIDSNIKLFESCKDHANEVIQDLENKKNKVKVTNDNYPTVKKDNDKIYDDVSNKETELKKSAKEVNLLVSDAKEKANEAKTKLSNGFQQEANNLMSEAMKKYEIALPLVTSMNLLQNNITKEVKNAEAVSSLIEGKVDDAKKLYENILNLKNAVEEKGDEDKQFVIDSMIDKFMETSIEQIKIINDPKDKEKKNAIQLLKGCEQGMKNLLSSDDEQKSKKFAKYGAIFAGLLAVASLPMNAIDIIKKKDVTYKNLRFVQGCNVKLKTNRDMYVTALNKKGCAVSTQDSKDKMKLFKIESGNQSVCRRALLTMKKYIEPPRDSDGKSISYLLNNDGMYLLESEEAYVIFIRNVDFKKGVPRTEPIGKFHEWLENYVVRID